jgi:hypothetical protein
MAVQAPAQNRKICGRFDGKRRVARPTRGQIASRRTGAPFFRHFSNIRQYRRSFNDLFLNMKNRFVDNFKSVLLHCNIARARLNGASQQAETK